MKTVVKVTQPGHVGEIIQVPMLVYDRCGGEIRCEPQVQLVTLPCPLVGSEITLFRHDTKGINFIGTGPLTKALTAAKLLAEYLEIELEGTFFIEHRFPGLGPGVGIGRSSADVIGTLRAVLASLGLPEEHLAEFIGQLAQQAETAVDPLLFPNPVLFASREGRVLKHYPEFPPMVAIGFVFDQPVDTVALATQQAQDGFPSSNLAMAPMVVKLLETAINCRDSEKLAEAATLSSELNQDLVPFPDFTRLRDFAARARTGLSISHSGSVGALLIPGTPAPSEVAALTCEFEKTFGIRTFTWGLPC